MKKIRGFTLIELVVVIVILGILGAVAAPKFIAMQSEAYKANLMALKMHIHSAALLGHTKAIIHGYDQAHQPKANSLNDYQRDDTNGDIDFMYGFPDASGFGIISMMQDSAKFSFGNEGDYLYTHRAKDYSRLTIAPRARHQYGDQPVESLRCELIYQAPKKLDDTPEITIHTQGC